MGVEFPETVPRPHPRRDERVPREEARDPPIQPRGGQLHRGKQKKFAPEMIMEFSRDEFLISTDRSRLDMEAIQRFLEQDSYWARERTPEQTKTAIENSICFGV